MEEYMLTTIDNPYDPFTQFDLWYNFDESQGYHTCGLLARFAFVSNSVSEEENDAAIDAAIEEVLRINPFGVHIKVNKKDKEIREKEGKKPIELA